MGNNSLTTIAFDTDVIHTKCHCMTKNPYVPPNVVPHETPLGAFASLRAAKSNVLDIIPAISYRQPIVSGKTGPARWHMVQGPEGMRRVFLENVENYPKAEVMIRMLRPAVGASLFTAEGADWRWQRRAIAPVFAARNVDALAPIMTATAERTAAKLTLETGPKPIVSNMMEATFDVICDVALSGRDHFDVQAYSAAITRYFLTIGRASLLDFARVPPWFPRPAELLGAGAVRRMHKMVAKAISDRQTTGPKPQFDLLDHVMAAQDPQSGQKMSARDVLHNMQFFIVAGHETTALAISWALLMLANDPQAQEAMAREARAQLGSNPARAQDLAQMPLVQSVLQESMRLYPPVGFLAREAREADHLYDRTIAPKDAVFLSIYALHRHELYWHNPNHFQHDRFLPEPAAKIDKFLHLPFGAGPRICVGANFAIMQASIILATLLARFKFTPAGPAPRPVMHMTIRPDPEVMLNVHPRNE